MKRSIWTGMVSTISFSLLLAGCGGVATKSSTAPDTAKKDTASSNTNSSPSEIKIGAPYPLTGAWAENGQNSLNGMKLAAEEINKNGGIKSLNGAKLNIVSVDTGSDNPSNASTVTSRLIKDEKVSAIVGAYVSSMTLPASTAAEQGKVPMMTQSYVDTITGRGYKYIFQLPPKASVLGKAAIKNYLEILKSQGKTIKNVAIIGTNDASIKAQNDALKNQCVELGLNVGAFIDYPVDLRDASAVVSQLDQAKPDVIFAGGALPPLVLVVKAIRSRGISAPIVGPAGGGFLTKGFPDALGENAENAISVSAWNDDMKLDGVKEGSEAYKKEFKMPFMPQEAGESYVAVKVLAQAMEKAKSADPEKIRETLATTEFTSGPSSAMPPGKIAFDATGLNKYAEPIVIQWQGGVPKTVWPKEVASTPIK